LLVPVRGSAAERESLYNNGAGVFFPDAPSRFFKERGGDRGRHFAGGASPRIERGGEMPNAYGTEPGLGSTPEQPNRDWERTAEEAARKAGEAAGEVEQGARRVMDTTSRKLRNAKESATAAYERTADGAERAYRGALDYARQNPGRAAAACFAAGVGVGMTMSSRDRGFGRGLVPVVAIALANAVLDVFNER
jgi:hypothetical protein